VIYYKYWFCMYTNTMVLIIYFFGAHSFRRQEMDVACHLPHDMVLLLSFLLTMILFSLLSFLFTVVCTVWSPPENENSQRVGSGCFSGCVWYLSADLCSCVEKVSAVPGCSCHWCESFSLGAWEQWWASPRNSYFGLVCGTSWRLLPMPSKK
jgi:hypothetical protein